MHKGFVATVLMLLLSLSLVGQQIVDARTNVVAYDDETTAIREAYHDSPYYMELDEGWLRVDGDTSVRYIYHLEVETSWREYLTYLHVCGGREVRVYINEVEVGRSDDSRHWNEFLLSNHLRYGRTNTLSIEVTEHALGALLESDEHLVGLNGTPYLTFKNIPNIFDYTLYADYEPASKAGSIELRVSLLNPIRKGKYYVEAEVLDPQGKSIGRMGKWAVFNKRSEDEVILSRMWSEVAPWSAESPSLYTLILRLRNEKMEQEEILATRFGFRRIEVKDGMLLFNGKAITLKGVVYAGYPTDDSVARERMLKDIVAMKAANINAVRTARFSPTGAYFYNLCDRYGLYVVADANLMPRSDRSHSVATDGAFSDLFEHRVSNLYGRYKNQTSIIAWSLGSSQDNGVCMAAAYQRLKAIEKHRPVIFSAADHGDATDIIAPIDPSIAHLVKSLSKQPSRPYLIMRGAGKDSFDRVDSLWQTVRQHWQLQGLFAAEWPLTSAELSDLAHIYSAFDVSVLKMMPDEGQFRIYNRNDFTPFGDNIIEYNIFSSMRPRIAGGDLSVVARAGEGDNATIAIPHLGLAPGEELFVRFDMRMRSSGLVSRPMQPGMAIGTHVFPLGVRAERVMADVSQGEADSSLFSLLPELSFVGHETWQCEVGGELVRYPDHHTICRDRVLRYVENDGQAVCYVHTTQTVFGTGDIAIDYTVEPVDRARSVALRPLLTINHPFDSLSWFGLDREVSFVRNHSGIVGIYESAATDMERHQVRWCSLRTATGGLLVEPMDGSCSFITEGSLLRLVPATDSAFRLHLRPYTVGDPALMAGYDYPRIASGSLAPPAIIASEIHFSQPLQVSITSDRPCQIRYTLDGSEPDENSPLYERPITISATTVVKARCFDSQLPPSFTATRKFNYDYIVRTTFSSKPSPPYNRGADTLLFDGLKGTATELAEGWVGFAGGQVEMLVQLAKPINIDCLTLRYAHAPNTWAFAPQEVLVVLSDDGTTFADTLRVSVPFDPSDPTMTDPRVVELRLPIEHQAVGYLKIIPQQIAVIPDWHRGKGLNAWLLMDEIEVIERSSSAPKQEQ